MRLGALGPPHPHGYEPTRETIQNRQLEHAVRSGWPLFDRADLVFHRYGTVEHAPSGDLYTLHRGELVDVLYVSAAAYYVDERGQVVFLEHPPAAAPQTREELEERRAEREQRRQATRQR